MIRSLARLWMQMMHVGYSISYPAVPMLCSRESVSGDSPTTGGSAQLTAPNYACDTFRKSNWMPTSPPIVGWARPARTQFKTPTHTCRLFAAVIPTSWACHWNWSDGFYRLWARSESLPGECRSTLAIGQFEAYVEGNIQDPLHLVKQDETHL